ncbi:MAG TPA: hypothetical protein VMA98_04595 [Candidatus Acidoferrales bacterium]|nr:hypothetical protein [Candidatus Acidoferrales bacterium]
MNPVLRGTTIVMFGGICAVIFWLALQERKTWIAIGIPLVYAVYVVANVLIWRRMKQRS